MNNKELRNNVLNFINSKKGRKESVDNLARLIDDEPKNINPLTEIPEPKMILYSCEGILISEYFDSEVKLLEYIKKVKQFDNVSNFEVSIFEYFEDVAGKSDVIRKTIIGNIIEGNFVKIDEENRKSIMLCVCDTDGIGVYNERKSIYTGEFVWEYQEGGNLRKVYNTFKEHGIELKNDVYGKEEELFKLLKKEFSGPHWY